MANINFEKELNCSRPKCTQEQPSLKLKRIVPRGNKTIGYYQCKCGAKKKYEMWP
jgi:hypothetical protein